MTCIYVCKSDHLTYSLYLCSFQSKDLFVKWPNPDPFIVMHVTSGFCVETGPLTGNVLVLSCPQHGHTEFF